MTTLEREVAVLEALTAYLAGSGTLSELEELTASSLFEFKIGDTGPLVDLVRQIELHLAEYTNHHLTASELNSRLMEMAHNYTLEVLLGETAQARQLTGTTSVTVGEAHLWSRSGTPRVVAFA